ncbi:MAG: hypothetical protein PHQ23_17565 [Candidatus Wallbacteria bacterium]|nr:hypothetical protein [Candidatus Wallbacteria bacterium]
MTISSVKCNNRRKGFTVVSGNSEWWYPYTELEEKPAQGDRIVAVYPDPELGGQGFTYVLQSGRNGCVLMDQVLEYNRDPAYMRDLILYKLTLEVRRILKDCRLSRREIIRRLGTSASQFYRLLDQTNYRKTVDQMLLLLSVLNCSVDVRVSVRCA